MSRHTPILHTCRATHPSHVVPRAPSQYHTSVTLLRGLASGRLVSEYTDGGAHADMRCEAGYSTYLLGTLVRDRKMLTLEEAIRRITSVPAQVFGVPLRGTVASGMIADLVVFDPDTVGCGKQEPVNDFPGGGLRYIEKSTGIAHTILNGQILFSDGEQTGPLSGRVLRSNVEA